MGFAIMAPYLARSSRDLLQNVIYTNLVGCHPRTVRRIRSKLRTCGTTETPTNTPGRPKSITPPMLSALRGNLAVDPCLTLDEMAAFLRKHYEADISQYRSEQLVFVDESGIDKSIGIRRRGWAPRRKRPR
ncbi:uncharacterized protein CLUP02_16966 [Colletotrichum lupini]|uniref:Transposase n=1 Tax=Colletotrichum lupini TaxID=145971 RepID=A0A9Q8WQ64_9PEZI|nr:uncharacterized protein CLUP02_16966 [Colletotrichum lupini]KAK1714010.1 hypothetical protein BDP67DRAFT_489471 [Colletotrichum lupini]UQC91431.1 hypothetical protein CLUP02_16966 [Colletotrichum lupini]